MGHQKESIIIWGAGKIGRGFIADLFNQQGYQIVFIDKDHTLVEKLNIQKKYTVYKIPNEMQIQKLLIRDFHVINVSDFDKVQYLFNDISLIALSVFPDVFDEVASILAKIIAKRADRNPNKFLNILVCTNIRHAVVRLRDSILKYLDKNLKEYFERNIGLIECLIICIAVQPSRELIQKDELVVVTNGYPELIADKNAFKGDLPSLKGLVFTDNIEAEEQKKMMTYNMIHALYAYIGMTKGYKYVHECTRDKEINEIAKGALNEIGQGLISEFGFTQDEIAEWNKKVLLNMANSRLNDRLIRVGKNPIRKLKRNDRLTGAALLCRKNAIMPYYISKAIAHAFLFSCKYDESATRINNFVKKYGIKKAIVEYCQLYHEPDLVKLIFDHYKKIIEGYPLCENDNKIELIKKAYTLGFDLEKKYRGCGQCTLLAMFSMLDIKDDNLFQAATAFSGGMALCNDGVCGGYSGGVLFIGKLIGRKLDRMRIDGDKKNQYRSFYMAQKLHDKFINTYGSVICKDIHCCIFGKWFYLREKEIREKFEQAGAHQDKCTSVIANACAWITEILIDEGFIKV